MTTTTQGLTLLSRCRASGLLGVIVFTLSFALTPSAQAQFTYSDFSDISNLARNGRADLPQNGTTLRLTRAESASGYGLAGSAWFTTPQAVTNGFETTFTFEITSSAGSYCDSPGGGDGLTFTIQNNDTTALKLGGGYLGYNGMPNSVAVEFDTCYNTWDPGTLQNRNHNHIGINLGSVASVTTVTPSVNINSGDVYAVRIAYQSNTLDVYFDDLVDPVLSHSVDLLNELGGETAYVGFTSGVALSYGNHDVLSWSFTPNLDSDGDGVVDDSDNCPAIANPSQSDIDLDDFGDLCDDCPNDSSDSCDPDGSSAEEVSNDGGTVQTPNEELTLYIGPGALGQSQDATISITDAQPTNPAVDLSIGTGANAGQSLAAFDLGPNGLEFFSAISVTFLVDVTNINANQRSRIDVYKLNEATEKYEPLVPSAACIVDEEPSGTFVAECTAQLASFSVYALVAPLDTDGDGVPDNFKGIVDVCPQEDATGFDVDSDGCIDSFSGLLDLLSNLVSEGVIDSNLQNSLTQKIGNAENSAEKESLCAAVNQLDAFKNQVAAQTGKKISIEAADLVSAYADNLIAILESRLVVGSSCHW